MAKNIEFYHSMLTGEVMNDHANNIKNHELRSLFMALGLMASRTIITVLVPARKEALPATVQQKERDLCESVGMNGF